MTKDISYITRSGRKVGVAFCFSKAAPLVGGKEPVKKEIIGGFEIPRTGFVPEPAGEQEAELVNEKYPLIIQDNKVMAFAHISTDPAAKELVYRVIEPKLGRDEALLMQKIKYYIQEKIDINFSQLRKREAADYVLTVFNDAMRFFGQKQSHDIIKYYVLRDFIGLEKIEPLMMDKMLEDISCDGVGIPLYIYHRNPGYGSVRTNIVFGSAEELDSFVNKIAERCGKSISITKPLLDGTLPDGSRLQATLGSDIARHGSNFTIRMFTEKPITPYDMVNYGTLDIETLTYLWLLVEHGSSILISGGTATGKTSLLNVISLFIKPQMKIVSIEDTAELKLPHAHWVPEVARTPISEEGKVDMFELLRESLRQRPDYIVVGEVRGREASVLFQQMAVGHAGLSTIHAESFPKLMDRLMTYPISLPPGLVQNLDAIIFLKRVKKGKKYMRRINSLVEVVGFDEKNKMPITNEVFAWNPVKDAYKITNKSAVARKIAESSGMGYREFEDEFRKKAKVIEWMVKKKIRDYKKIGMLINLFYTSPDFLMEKIEAGL